MQENLRINRQDRQKITFPGSANPKEISQQCTPATHTEAVHQRVHLGAPPSLIKGHQRLLDPPLGRRVAKPLVSCLTPVSPIDLSKFMKGTQYEFVHRRRPIEYSVAENIIW